jgi:hypothetical protein
VRQSGSIFPKSHDRIMAELSHESAPLGALADPEPNDRLALVAADCTHDGSSRES